MAAKPANEGYTGLFNIIAYHRRHLNIRYLKFVLTNQGRKRTSIS